MGAAGTVTESEPSNPEPLDVDFGVAPEDEREPEISGGTGDDTKSGAASEKGKAEGEPEADPDRDAAVKLLGQEQYDKIKDNPAKLAKGLHQSYTKKMQGLSGYADFIRSIEEDPEGTLREYAKQVGLEVSQKKAADPDAAVEGVRTKLAEVIGEEAANGLLPILDEIVNSKIQPTLDKIAGLDRESALNAAESLIQRFKTAYPDFPKYADAMEKLGLEVLPGKGADEYKYMERLYKLVKADTDVADEADKSIQRMTASARSAEKPATGVPHSRVAPVPSGKKVTFEEAWEAARRGISWDPNEVRAARKAKS